MHWHLMKMEELVLDLIRDHAGELDIVVLLVVTHWHLMKVEELILDLMHTGVCLVHPMRKQDYPTALRLLAMRLEEGSGK